MSGIYIPGMELPKSCWRCCLSKLYEQPRERLVCKVTHEEVVWHKVDSNCPLVPVPDHGPLVDWNTVAEKLNETFSWLERDEETGMIHRVYHPLLDMHPIRVPVIIPASKEEE